MAIEPYARAVFKSQGVYYEQRRDGPLVALTSLYSTNGGAPKNLLTREYFNFSHLAGNPSEFDILAKLIIKKYADTLGNVGGILAGTGAGRYLGYALSEYLHCPVAHTEKKYLEPPRPPYPGVYRPVLAAGQTLTPGEIIIVDDVCVKLSLIISLMKLALAAGCEVSAVVCLVNRSSQLQLIAPNFLTTPILSLLHKQTQCFRQEEVADQVKAGKVEWEPKKNWHNLLRYTY